MKRIILSFVLLGLVLLGGQAVAEIGTIDAVPAATLLLPRFEVDLVDPRGITTLFSINNASASPALAHVTLWSEFSVPVLDFDVYLTGFDVQTLNVRDIIVDGILPQTGANRLVSNIGAFSEGFGFAVGPNTFPPLFGPSGCTTGTTAGQIPIYNPLSGVFRQVVQQALSSQVISAGSLTGQCASFLGGNPDLARGYITIDSVSRCSQEFPDSPGYFVNGGLGVANNSNVLWGDWFLVTAGQDFAQGFTLVHVEAAFPELSSDPATNPLGVPSCTGPAGNFNPTTFYCRFTGLTPGADNREALGSISLQRYIVGGAFTGGTDYLVYRDPDFPGSAVDCTGGVLAPFLFTQNQIVVFDEEENPVVGEEGPSGFDPAEENPFPWETNRSSVGEDITVVEDFGWIYLNLNGALALFGPPFDLDHTPAWVEVVMSAEDRFSVGFEAIQVNNLTLGTPITNDNCILGPFGTTNCPNFPNP